LIQCRRAGVNPETTQLSLREVCWMAKDQFLDEWDRSAFVVAAILAPWTKERKTFFEMNPYRED